MAKRRNSTVDVYSTVERNNPEAPKLLRTIEVEKTPSQLLVNSVCTMLVVSNENRGGRLDEGGVTLVRDLDSEEPSLKFLSMTSEDEWDDKYVIDRGLHMALTKNSLSYWDGRPFRRNVLNFTLEIDNYKTAIFLEPESLAWGNPEEDELIVNLQKNNGMIRVDVVNDRVVNANGYGYVELLPVFCNIPFAKSPHHLFSLISLKDHGEVKVDINREDKQCILKTYRNLFALRTPNYVTTLRYNGRRYIVTANEGGNKRYEGFRDELDAGKIFLVRAFPRPLSVTEP